MQNRSFGRFTLLSLLAISLVVSACGPKKVTGNTPTPAQPETPIARPTVTLQASPAFLQSGQSSTLTWNSTNATSLSIAPGVGSVAPEGSTQVTPTQSGTYTITATGPGGTAEQTVRITVGEAAPPEQTNTVSESAEEAFNKNVMD